MKSFVIVLKNHLQSEEFGNDCIESGSLYGWNVSRFDAIDGRNLKVKDLNRFGLKLYTKYRKTTNAMTRAGVLGNLLSHWHLWKHCIELNEPIGCFEHDVIFKKPFSLIDFKFNDCLKLDRLQIQKNYGTGSCWQGAHAYIIKPSGAKKLLNWGYENGVTNADVMIGTEILNIEFNNSNIIEFNKKSLDYSTSRTETFQ